MSPKKPRKPGETPAAAPAAADAGSEPAPEDAEGHEPLAETPAFPVVGIGASAGGLEAFQRLLGALPPDTGMAFVVVSHLDPTHASRLPELLARVTSMPVTVVEDEPEIAPGRVYVIPPGREMALSDGRLHLLPRETRGPRRTIDLFFRSLAEDRRHASIGVVLSGTGSDGTLGLGKIKAEGGITFAQDETAAHNEMPVSARTAGCVDFVLPPEEIAREIARISRHPFVGSPTSVEQRDRASRAALMSFLHESEGVDFTDYKPTTLHRRITRRMLLRKTESLADYGDLVRSEPAELAALYRDVLIGVTSFFRDPESFEALKSSVFPALVKGRSRHEPLRVWVLGCSTGEEAYSLAMAYSEYCNDHNVHVPLQLFATDVNGPGLDRARAGVYAREAVQDVPPERLRRFFVETDGGYRVASQVRDVCVFARHNALADPPFSRLDMVSCRNLLIYLQPILQRKLVHTFHYALRSDGFLWLGSSESLGSYRELFQLEDAKHKVYARKDGVTRPHIPAFPPRLHEPAPRGRPAPARVSPAPASAQLDVQKEADRILMSRYVPPAVLVDTDLEIVQFRGDTSPYLAPAPGRASLNLLKMAREGLFAGVRTAVERARTEEGPVVERGLRVRGADGFREVDVEVLPVRGASARDACFLVLFSEDGAGRPSAQAAAPSLAEEGAHRLADELVATREYLQSVIEQREAANEELQAANEEVLSANEELQSMNEELETSKEEIQSTNEELVTVNDELRSRNQELAEINDDLTNLIAGVQLAILILGRDLRIRRFTSAAADLLRLIPADVGRPVQDVNLHLDAPDLVRTVAESIDRLEVVERETRHENGRWYSMRVRPYRTLDDRIEGAVVVLLDVDALKRAGALRTAEEDLRRRVAELAAELSDRAAPPTALVRRATEAKNDAERRAVVEELARFLTGLARRVELLAGAAPPMR